MSNSPTFALDIGTRSVVGLILEKTEKKFQIIDILSKEHRERSMLDGQIHDVLAVSEIINEIKQELEEKHGPLKKVCVAAAGRALKTIRSNIALSIAGKPMMEKQDVIHLELSAVQQAQHTLAQENHNDNSAHYYCVGYSVIHYYLDQQEIGNLVDQQGDEASVDIIATFLPKVVVESLLAALTRANLEMEALTLEPIAAINVLIPPSMRRLNVALVDIGAGTSDIAITDLSTVVAYGMVPNAGDEITEAISDEFLLDFPLAEKAKRDLSELESITISDILGFETEVASHEVIGKIHPAIDKLATAICDEIIMLNKKPPKAVMLVGGGSLTPMLPQYVAQKLQLPENRVAIRGIDAIQNISLSEHIQKGPELVTPIGIAIAAKQNPVQYMTVKVNERTVRLFDIKKVTVGDCLLAAGIEIKKLYGRPGMAAIVTINGQQLMIPGKHGKAPILLRNGETTAFSETVENGDQLTVERGEDGLAPQISVKEVLDLKEYRIIFNGEEKVINPIYYVNGKKVNKDHPLEDRDKIEWHMPNSIRELVKHDLNEKLYEKITVFVNDKPYVIEGHKGTILKNRVPATVQETFMDGDEISVTTGHPPTVEHLIEQLELYNELEMVIFFNNKPITIQKPLSIIYRDGEKLEITDSITHNDRLIVNIKNEEPFIFQDIFRYVDVDIQQNESRSFVLLRNDEKAAFYDEIQPGDKLQLIWKK